jgi:fatty-acyl-CoA synthase
MDHPRSGLRPPPPQGGDASGPAEPDPRCPLGIDARLRRWVQETPDALAIVGDDESVTWRELDARIDSIALPPAGQAIGWLGHNSIAMLATFFACARRGVVFVPLNVRLAEAELQAIVEHAGLAQVIGGLAPAHEPQRFEGGDLLLAYTSGTTGTPKGALHTHAAMLANIDAAIATQGFDRGTRALAVLPLFHVGGLCIQTLPVLAAGGVVRLHTRFDALAWLRDVAQWRPSTSLVVPAVMRALIEHPDWASTDVSSLRFVGAGSSIIPRALIESFHARGVPVAQVYGATESGPVSVVLRPAEAMAHVGSAGRPVPGVNVRVVGGEVGELWISGPNVMRGYHREPQAENFRDGWFHSGDLGRMDEQGFIEIVGRSKDMIISGGENIYPAEIENLLTGHPDIAEAAVVGVPDARWGEAPVLAVVPRAGHVIDTGTLSALFEGRLARYKQPRRIVVVDALPKTALGKVRRLELAQDIAVQLRLKSR